MSINAFFQKYSYVFLLTAVLITLFYSAQIGSDINWDLRNYHFYNGYAQLTNRFTQDWRPSFLQSNMNTVLDVPLYVMIKTLPPFTVSMILTTFQVLNLFLIFKISRIIIGKSRIKNKTLLALISTLVGFFSASNLGQIGGTMGDNLVSVFILCGILVLYEDRKGSRLHPMSLLISGLFFGLAIGLKLPYAIYLPGFGLAIFLKSRAVSAKYQNILLAVLGLSLGFLLSAGQWMQRGISLYQNPFFPFFNGIFKSKYLMSDSFFDNRFLPSSVSDYFIYPYKFIINPLLVSEVPFRDYRIFTAYVLLLVSVFLLGFSLLSFGKLRNLNIKLIKYRKLFFGSDTLSVFLFWFISYILWLNLFSIYRYAIVLEFLSPLVTVLIIGSLIESLMANVLMKHLSYMLLISVLLIIQIQTKPIEWERMPWARYYFTLDYNSNEQNLANSTLLLYGYSPYGFLVPLLPASTNVLRVSGVETSAQQQLIASRIRQKVFLLKEIGTTSETINISLSQFSLMLDDRDCQQANSNISDLGLVPYFKICEIKSKPI